MGTDTESYHAGLTRMLSKIRSKVSALLSYRPWKKSQKIAPSQFVEDYFRTHSEKSVLISYIIYPFIGSGKSNDHSNYQESLAIAEVFHRMGYSVDIVHWNYTDFIPQKEYSLILDNHDAIERLNLRLGKNCIKICYITNAHPNHQNLAELLRLREIQHNRGVSLPPQRQISFTNSIAHCQEAITLGNEFTMKTYPELEKRFYRLPVTSVRMFPWQKTKDFDKVRKNYLWFGSHGFALKGLDLVLEAFKLLPDYQLIVCGYVEREEAFCSLYSEELYRTANIRTLGWMDVHSVDFEEIVNSSLAVIYPSASEGGGGSVIACMQAGLIPVVSYEASVDVKEFGIQMKDRSIDSIIQSIQKLSSLSTDELNERSLKSWSYANSNHSIQSFTRKFEETITVIIQKYGI